MPYYDLQNTSYNPNASLPRNDIHVARTLEVDVEIRDLLLTHDYLVVFGEGAKVFNRANDTVVWDTDEVVFTAAFGPPNPSSEYNRVLYLATETADKRDATVTALGLRDEGVESLFDTTIEGQNVASILPTDTALFVGSRGVDGYLLDPETGDRTATLHGRLAAIDAGKLVTTTYGRVSAYEIDTGGLLSDGEVNPVWQTGEFEGRGYHPASANGRLLVGSFGTAEGSASGHFHCFDSETGNLLWDPKSFGWATWTPAVDGDVGYVAGNDPGSGTGRIAAVDFEDGSTVWEHVLDWQPIEPIAAGDGVVIVRHDGSSSEATPGYVEAYDGATGETLWSFELGTEVRRVRAAGKTVFLVTDGALHVLKSA